MTSAEKKSKATKKVLVLGAGLCSKPGIEYLATKGGFDVVVGSRTLAKAEAICADLAHATAMSIDVETATTADIDAAMSGCDAVLSMLPYLHHPTVAARAVANKVHFFSTSYESDGMRALEDAAKAAGVVLFNECGVDPGTDHMSAMRLMDKAKAAGAKVTLFKSFCGGLPAPADNDNPFGYKFSWAPRGVLLASRNGSRFMEGGKVVDVAEGTLFENYSIVHVDGVEGCTTFECYPNRDSTAYQSVYGLPNIQSLQRGTFRYPGFCDKVLALSNLGFLSLDENPAIGGKTMGALTAQLCGCDVSADLRAAVKTKLGVDDTILDAFEWAGLFGDDKVAAGTKTLLDALCDQLLPRMKYTQGQRDMLLMQHEYEFEYPDRVERHTTTMVDYGLVGGDSSMSRLVSIPMAIAMRLVLNGDVVLTPGLHRPLTPEFYNPILDELDTDYNVQYVDKHVSTCTQK